MNRTDRLVAMVMHLQGRRLVRAEDMAGHFSVSVRTIYRDIAALGEAGVPIAGEAGVGYSLVKGYHLPPVMLTGDEAAALFDRSGAHPAASLGRAAMALDRGDARSAAELTERHLRRLPAKNRTERAGALELLIRAETALGGDHNRARSALVELQGIADTAHTPPLLASASLAVGLIALAEHDADPARRALEDAVDLFEKSGAPFEAARARVGLACALESLGRTDAAVVEVSRALEELTRLDARHEMAAAQAVRDRLTPTPAQMATPGATREKSGLTTRELEVLRLISSGLSNPAIADRLCISEHTVHRHVANTLTKLDVPSRSAAVAQAARLGLL
ncbi:MAG: LuxR C-terminal-related transcriptional regulator [Vicinamibacterales bacterium]